MLTAIVIAFAITIVMLVFTVTGREDDSFTPHDTDEDAVSEDDDDRPDPEVTR
ncbi:hypothetical protein GCM10025873_05010 [Demequina sediminis]|uniref:hypothetical protein n=1 Tax=Demequina sediminis TaxID=1930058 RepID=UPI0025726703|nr:hypothetical protein [Demequina sediminis]BDZ60710.1 hypothetical protein GCM10025873_05010 [Demequina sediminis]